MLVFSLAVVSFVAIVSVVIKDVLRIMADPSFWPAARVVPLVLAAYAFDALGNYTKFGILLKKRTGLLVYGNLIATGVISVGYFTLIPRLGAIGAALATLCAYAVRFAWITAVSQKLYRLDIPWRQISLAAVSGLVICVAAQLGPDGLVGSLCFSGLLVTAFFLSLFFLPVLPAGLRSQLISGMTHPKSTLTNYLRSLTG
jgi:O-antigen/teichoic acid export membrane protein